MVFQQRLWLLLRVCTRGRGIFWDLWLRQGLGRQDSGLLATGEGSGPSRSTDLPGIVPTPSHSLPSLSLPLPAFSLENFLFGPQGEKLARGQQGTETGTQGLEDIKAGTEVRGNAPSLQAQFMIVSFETTFGTREHLQATAGETGIRGGVVSSSKRSQLGRGVSGVVLVQRL